MGGKSKSNTVRVTPSKNLDLMNIGQVAELEKDEQVTGLLEAGYLIEVDEDGQPVDKSINLGQVTEMSPSTAQVTSETVVQAADPDAKPDAKAAESSSATDAPASSSSTRDGTTGTRSRR